VENEFGQKLSYTYTKDTKTVTANPCNGSDTKPVDLALYPQYILYPHSRYRVEFKRESRNDYKSDWWSDPARTTFFQRYRLDKVEIQHDPAGTGSWSAVRTYDLSYNQEIYSAHTWSAGGKSFAVSAIQQSGTGGATRPAAAFGYDGVRLTEVDNGYGGEASFSYETTPWAESQVNEDYEHTTPDGGSCPYNWSGDVSCSGSDLRLNGTGQFTLGQFSVQPGGVYELRMKIRNYSGVARNLVVKFEYAGSGGYYTLFNGSVAASQEQDLTTQMVLPLTAYRLRWVVEGTNFHIKKMETRLLLTRYRVEEKTVDGGITDDGTSQGYEYDGPASNDEAHSQAVAEADNYESKYRSFRGHAASRVIGPTQDGLTRVDTSWYRQDDDLNGRQVGGMTMLESYHTAFETSVCGSGWTCAGSQPSLTRLEGDNALQLTDPDGGWNTAVLRSSYSLAGTSGAVNTALVQFRTSSHPRQMGLGVEKGSFDAGYRRFAVWMDTDGALKTQVYIGTSPAYTTLLPSASFKADAWYVLLLVVDDQNGFWLSAWPRDHPEDRVEFRYVSSSFTGHTWRFIAWSNQGTLSLDEYSEGKVYSFSASGYDIDNAEYTPIGTSEPSGYTDLQIGWAPITNTVSLSFEGGSLYLGNWSHLEYLKADQNNSQYGNQTRQEDAWWDGDSWVKYRATRSQYYPYTSSTKHLVGLPGSQNVYDCPVGSCDYGIEDIVSSQMNLYDGASNGWTAPTYGKLTRTQQFVCFANSSGVCYEGYNSGYSKLLYSDQALSYDTWGNTVNTTTFEGYGELGVPASSGGRSSLAGYDPTYHTYLVSQTSPMTGTLTTKSFMGYDYALGLPNLQIDPNGGVSTVTYDGLGSPTELRVEGDEGGRASIGAGYFLSWQPMMIDLQQKVVQSEVAQTYNQRKFFDGRGRLIQQQTAKAKLADNACSTDSGVDPDDCDIVIDTWVSGDGLEQRQSVPYALSYWYSGKPNEPNPYRGQRIEPGEASPVPYTTTRLDLLGRAVQVAAPDGTITQTSYAILVEASGPYQQTCTTDANNNTTCTRTDSRGRTVEVDPPEGPGVAYTYDSADRLKTATMGGAETELWYDYAGRKTKMDDADMGFWQYGYNALGQLIDQTDARGCQTNLNYDLAGRLSSKSYTLGSCGAAATSSVTNTHDGTLHWQPFDSWPSTGWTKLGSVTVSNGQVHLAGNGTDWNTYIHRDGKLNDGQAVRFSFQANTTAALANLMVESGTWGTSEYRRWSLKLESGYLKRESYTGSTPSTISLMALKANTWYEGVLSIDGTLPANSSESYNPRFRVVVWERDNPNVWAQNRTQFATGWNGKEWYFFAQVKSGTVDIDYEQEYDEGAIGQRSKMIDGSGNTEWVYTSRGQVQSEKKTIGTDIFLNQYGYHPDGSVRWMQYPGGNASQAGEKLEFTYLPQKALESVFSSSNSYFYLQKATYDAAGRLDVRNLGAPDLVSNPLLKTDLEYFGWDQQGGRLKTLKTGIPTDLTSLQSFEYDYDPVGNIDWIKDFKAGGTQTQSFGYDSLDRLISAQASGGTGGTYGPFTYAFSASTGNLTGKEGTTLSYNASVSCPAGTRSIPHAASSFGSTTYSYDCNGNQVSKTVPGMGTQNRTFDAENRLVGVSGTATASFVYDGDGQRVKGTVGSTTTVYLGAFFEWTGSTSTMKRYYYAGSIRIAIRVGNGSGTTGLSWLFGDHLGSTSLAVDMNATRTGEHRYRPYGENRFFFQSLPTTFDFTGQRVDSYINLLWYNSRWYDPALGRWIQPDSIVPEAVQGIQAWDRMAYVNNNPVRYEDPSGHCILLCSVIGAVGGGIVGGVIYAITTKMSGREWNNKDLLVSIGTGAVGGALIGTGVGAAAGIATFAAIGAGSGVIAGELGYSATAGESFDSGDMVIAAAASGVAGGITGGIGASSIAGSGTAFTLNMLANGGASAAQYTATQLSNGQTVNPALAAVNGLAGGIVGGAADLILGGSTVGNYADRWMSVANNPGTRPSLSNASRMAGGGLAVFGVEQFPRSGIPNVITHYWQKKLAEAQ
jgi:RHS repeat-associated protein